MYVYRYICIVLTFVSLARFFAPDGKHSTPQESGTATPQIALPVLPDSFLGWIPALYRVTEEQVLGLCWPGRFCGAHPDAYAAGR